MPDFALVDEWLDCWEELRETGQAPPLDQFIERHCQGAAPELVARFREQVRALESMDVKLQAAGVQSGDSLSDQPVAYDQAQSEIRPGTEAIPGHVLECRLGKGGFGEVWKARAPGGFHVALKFVRLERRVRAAELRALETIKAIRHPHLLSVFGAYQQNGRLIIAMELAERTLEQRFREARTQGLPGIPRDELLEYLAEAAKGLDYLNEPRHPSGDGAPRGIQHRDIKPQNLLLSGGSIKVGDFGLARCLEHSLVSHTGSLTAAYAAPEFFKGQTTSHSDQYSLAATYCHLRGGRLPFTGNAAELMAGHLNREPDLSMLPPEEWPAVARALAKEAKGRWPSCGEFVKVLRQAGSRQEPTRPPTNRNRRSTSETEKPRRWLVVGAVAALIAVAGAAALWLKLAQHTAAVNNNPASEAASPSQDEAAPGTVTLAVLDFDNHAKDPALDGFRQGLRDMLVTDLARVSKVKVVERSRLNAVMDEQKLARTDFIDPRTAVRLGKGLSAKSLLTGSYLISGDDVRVDVRLISVETGEIQLADKVVGTKADFFRLEQALAAKVLAALQVRPDQQEGQALGEPQTRDFEAFRLYTEALLAQQRGRQKEAEANLRQALARDPQFGLARRELSTVEASALTRLADAEKDRLARAGQVGKALEEHIARHQGVVTKGRRDPAYLAGLIILSADAGLLGDPARERKLLLHYWKEFAEHVPAEKALATGAEVQKLVAVEGKFFQEQVDAGDYSTFLDGFSKPEQYLKPELHGAFSWPVYAAIWPFDFGAREAFRVVRNDQGVKVDPEHFEKQLPRYPHDCLRRLLENPKGRPADPAFVEALRLQQSVLRYYARLKDRPADLAERLTNIERDHLSHLDRNGPEAWGKDFVPEAVTALELMATASADGGLRQEANRLLLQYVRQAKLNAGGKGETGAVAPAPAPISPVTFCSLRLSGPCVVFLCEPGEADNFLATNFVQKELANAMRSLSPAARFNVCLFGSLKKDARATAFKEVRPADDEARRTALAYVQGIKASADVVGDDPQEIDLGTALASVLAAWPAGEAGRGDVCIICYGNRPKIASQVLEHLKKREAGRPKVHFVGLQRVPALGEVVQRSGGSAVLLEEDDLLQVEPKRWSP
jgi:serine/threonine protein kinase